MGILLIESSSKKIEFGYAEDDKLLFSVELHSNDNADTLTFFIKNAFEKKDLKFKDIETVSLSNGPGSFTGLRIGSAIAKGICFANGSKLVEISTLDIIAQKGSSEPEFSELSKHKIVSLIFSNTRIYEFYYCEYEFDLQKMKRVSDYKIDVLENILNNEAIFVTNENNIDKEYFDKIKNVSGISNIPSQLELTLQYIKENKFTDFNISEPFYMKDFVPKI